MSNRILLILACASTALAPSLVDETVTAPNGAALRRQHRRRQAQHAAPVLGGRGNLVGSYDQTLSVVLTVYGN